MINVRFQNLFSRKFFFNKVDLTDDDDDDQDGNGHKEIFFSLFQKEKI